MRLMSRLRVQIPRQSARPKRSKQQARPKRPGRTADLAVRYMRIPLRPAHYHADKAPIDIRAVHALEENPPPNTEAVEWFLLTTIEIGSADEAEPCLRWYCLPWRIEDWHRVLKSGCRIEAMAHDTADRLRRAIAITLVIAWRIMLMTLLGREVPDLPAELLFSDVELRTLHPHAKKTEATHVAGRCCAFGGKDRRIPRPQQRSATRPSTDVAGLCGIPIHVPGVCAERRSRMSGFSYG